MKSPSPERAGGLPLGPSALRVVRLIVSGVATSRADLVSALDQAPSTVSTQVQDLIDRGILAEAGEGPSTGGRRPRLLTIRGDAGFVLAADLGAHHVRLGALDAAGRRLMVDERAHDQADGPERTVDWLAAQFRELMTRDEIPRSPLLGIGIGVPGPVDVSSGRVVAPSRMPGWHGAAVREVMSEAFEVPVTVDNDANTMALGEHLQERPDLTDFVLVKVGSGIGCGIVSGGHLHRGAAGAAGDISHVHVPGATALCECGNVGCLETVASGAAIEAELREAGVAIDHPRDIARLVENGHPVATQLARQAGRQLGEVLAVVVNFFNPQAVLLGGALGDADPLLAAVRGVLYERSLPLNTQELEIGSSRAGVDAGIIGSGLMVLLERVFAGE